MVTSGRRSGERLRRFIEAEILEYAREKAQSDGRCGTALGDLAGFDKKLLCQYGLLHADEKVARCGTRMDDAAVPASTTATPTAPAFQSLSQH